MLHQPSILSFQGSAKYSYSFGFQYVCLAGGCAGSSLCGTLAFSSCDVRALCLQLMGSVVPLAYDPSSLNRDQTTSLALEGELCSLGAREVPLICFLECEEEG